MKAAIFNPYLDTLGGGERYSMAVARALIKAGYKVEVEWKKKAIKKRLEDRFGIDLKGLEIVADVKRGDGYDVCFWLSDGSIPTLKARKNLLHFQFPFKDLNGKTLLNKMKLLRINKIICNSQFTKSYIDKSFGVKSVVVYPPVDTKRFKPKRKEDLILGVGRFSQLTQQKRQDVLIKAFKKFIDRGNTSWKMVLAGGTEVGADDYLKKLKSDAKGYPIEIMESPSIKKIAELYGKAKVFVSACGFGVDEQKEPLKVEHFGITVVEAMSARAVPVVYSAGGHKEIIKDKDNGFLWKKTKQLTHLLERIAKGEIKIHQISKKAKEDSKKYSHERFEKEIIKLL